MKAKLGNNGTIIEQIAFQEEMQAHGLNLVTCGKCDSVFLHRTNKYVEDAICPFCKTTFDTSDLEDMFYSGMPEETAELT